MRSDFPLTPTSYLSNTCVDVTETMSEQKSRKSKFLYLEVFLMAGAIFGSGMVCGHYLFPKTRVTIHDYPVAVPVPNDPPTVDTFTMYRT
jgi:hypothetical protein